MKFWRCFWKLEQPGSDFFIASILLNIKLQLNVIEPTFLSYPLQYGPRYEWDKNEQSYILGGFFWGYLLTSLFGSFSSVFSTNLIDRNFEIFRWNDGWALGWSTCCWNFLVLQWIDDGRFSTCCQWLLVANLCCPISSGRIWRKYM